MQILFNKTIEQCRQLGARGGRAYGRNLRLRQSQAPVPPVAQLPAPPSTSLEENEDLHTMWAALLANAASPDNTVEVRPGFISVLRQMSPDEAALLNWMVSFQERTVTLRRSRLGTYPLRTTNSVLDQ